MFEWIQRASRAFGISYLETVTQQIPRGGAYKAQLYFNNLVAKPTIFLRFFYNGQLLNIKFDGKEPLNEHVVNSKEAGIAIAEKKLRELMAIHIYRTTFRDTLTLAEKYVLERLIAYYELDKIILPEQ